MTAIIPGGLEPPFCTSLCSGAGAPAGFPKEKAGRRPGSRGEPPGAFLPTFAALGKSGWPRMGYPFSLRQRFICADKLQHTLQKWVWPAGHLLSLRRERRQRGAKGVPLGTPDGSVGFLFRKASPTRTTKPSSIQKGAAAPGMMVVINL